MDRIPSSIWLPIMAGIFVLVVGGGLGVIFTVSSSWHLFNVGSEPIDGTIVIGLAIVVLAPIVAGLLVRKRGPSS